MRGSIIQAVKGFPAVLAMAALTACAVQPPSAAQQADASVCTSQADATYNAQNYEDLSRTSQTGVRYSATPNHVFDGQELGALHARDSQITDCERNGGGDGGGDGGGGLPGAAPVVSHIVP